MIRRCLCKQKQVFQPNFRRNLFGWEKKKTQEDTHADDILDVEIEKQYEKTNASLFSTKYNMNLIKHKGKLTTQKAYTPPANVEEVVREVVQEFKPGEDWKRVELKDHKVKFNILSSLISRLNKDLPSHLLQSISTAGEALDFFKTEISLSSTYDELAARQSKDLPKNLHIQKEALRFNPSEDTLFGGRTAFPGSDTVVKSIKYKRKYEGCINTKEKPGFNNFYYGY